MKKEESVAKVNHELPDYLQRNIAEGIGGRGLENAGQKDYAIPRLCIAQSQSPQRKKSHDAYIEGLQEGQLFNNVTKEIYGASVNVAPLLFFRSRILFAPLEDGGGIMCQSANGKTGGVITPAGCDKCECSKWGPKGEQPTCTELMNYACVLVKPAGPELVVLSLKSTGVKIAKQWNSQMRMLGGGKADTFAGLYTVSVTTQSGNGNEWFQYKVDTAGWVPEQIYQFCEEQYLALKSRDQIDVAAPDNDDHRSTENSEV